MFDVKQERRFIVDNATGNGGWPAHLEAACDRIEELQGLALSRLERVEALERENAALAKVVEAARPLGAGLFIDVTVQDEARYKIRRAIDELAALAPAEKGKT
jgi:hypothetical protein